MSFCIVGCDQPKNSEKLSEDEIVFLYNLAVYYNTWKQAPYHRVCKKILDDDYTMDSVKLDSYNCNWSRVYQKRHLNSKLNGKNLTVVLDPSIIYDEKRGMINKYLDTVEPLYYSLPKDFEYFNHNWFDGRFHGYEKAEFKIPEWNRLCRIELSNLYHSVSTNTAILGYRNICGSHGDPMVNLMYFKKVHDKWFPYDFYIEPM